MMPDQSGRTWLVTGATNGVGRAVAQAAARAGARVLITARDPAKGASVCAELGGDVTMLELDLSHQDGVRQAAACLAERVDVLVNNAGTVVPRRAESRDGHELMLATNLLGPFALTNLILDRVEERVVIVGSGAHKRGSIDYDDPHFRCRSWSIAASYSQSKLGDLLWGLDLQRRLTAASSSVTVQLAHPGWALTNLQNATSRPGINALITAACRPFSQPADVAAESVLLAATAALPPCSYVGPGGFSGLRGEPALSGRSSLASDPQEAQRLWHLAASETGTDWP